MLFIPTIFKSCHSSVLNLLVLHCTVISKQHLHGNQRILTIFICVGESQFYRVNKSTEQLRVRSLVVAVDCINHIAKLSEYGSCDSYTEGCGVPCMRVHYVLWQNLRMHCPRSTPTRSPQYSEMQS